MEVLKKCVAMRTISKNWIFLEFFKKKTLCHNYRIVSNFCENDVSEVIINFKILSFDIKKMIK